MVEAGVEAEVETDLVGNLTSVSPYVATMKKLGRERFGWFVTRAR